MASEVQVKRSRVLGRLEKTILGFIAGGAAAVALAELVRFIQRVLDLVSGPVSLTGVPTSEPLDAGFANATFDTVSLTVTDLSAGGRAALVAAEALSSLLAIGICVALAWLCLRVFLGKPFVKSATWGIGIVAILVLVASMIRPLLTAIGEAEAARVLGAEQLPLLLMVVDPGPIAWGLALAVVAAAFEIGQRLQRDTEGLV